MDMMDYVKGKGLHRPLRPEIKEFLMAVHTGWKLEYIRNLPVKDSEVFSMLMTIYDNYKEKI